MEVFADSLLKELIGSLPQIFFMVKEFTGQIAFEGLKLVFLPFYEFSLTSCVVAIGWVAIFWRNKRLATDALLRLKD